MSLKTEHRKMTEREEDKVRTLLSVYNNRIKMVIDIRLDLYDALERGAWFDEEQAEKYMTIVQAMDKKHEFVYGRTLETMWRKKRQPRRTVTLDAFRIRKKSRGGAIR